jgi:hypothetical protein
MKCLKLTTASLAATTPTRRKAIAGVGVNTRWRMAMVVVGLAGGALGGCITVNAPDKPIVIELNINIKQEVVYRLAADAGKTIEDHKDIF